MHRQNLTQESLRGALTRLLAQKNLENISISELCRTAGINRTTFYLHYTDKYDYIEQLRTENIQQLHLCLEDSPQNPDQALLAALTYIFENATFFRVISLSSFTNWNQTIKNFMAEVIDRNPEALPFLVAHYHCSKDYAKEIFLSSLAGAISHWIQSGCPETPLQLLDILMHIPGFAWWRGQGKSEH